jgi:hypothetical protein
MGECLNNVDKLGGKAISVTTDGFLTNIEGLEDKILENDSLNKDCLMLYRDIRSRLTAVFDDKGVVIKSDDRALEIKKEDGEGLLS